MTGGGYQQGSCEQVQMMTMLMDPQQQMMMLMAQLRMSQQQWEWRMSQQHMGENEMTLMAWSRGVLNAEQRVQNQHLRCAPSGFACTKCLPNLPAPAQRCTFHRWKIGGQRTPTHPLRRLRMRQQLFDHMDRVLYTLATVSYSCAPVQNIDTWTNRTPKTKA